MESIGSLHAMARSECYPVAMRQALFELVLLALFCSACTVTAHEPRGGFGSGGAFGGAVAVAGSTSLGGNAGVSGGVQVGAAGTGGTPTVTAGAAAGGSAGSAGSAPITHPDMRTVVYLPSWRGSLTNWAPQLDFSRMTYLNLCFAEVDAQGKFSYADPELDSFVATAHSQGVKVCMAIGGASVIDTGGLYATVLQDGMRQTVVDNLAQFAIDHQLDCIDVDLEGNGVNQYYEAFVTSLAAKLHASGKEMTAAVGSWFGDRISVTAIQAFDFINVMAYDLHNPGGSTTPVQSASLEDATKEVDWWVNKGLAKDKAVYGVPFYGYRWTTGKGEALTYAQILAQAPDAATMDQVQLAGATTYLNSRATIRAKAKLARSYGGIMIWELGQDAAGDASLLKAIVETEP